MSDPYRRTTRGLTLLAVVGLALGGCSGDGQPHSSASAPAVTTSAPSGTTDATTAPAPTTSSPSSAGPAGTSMSAATTPLSSTAAATSTAPAVVSSVTVTGTVATGLTTPWGIGFLPDGTALVTERDTAKLVAISPGASPTVRTVGVVDGVVPNGEGGLLGLAVSPTFADDHTVYVYFTAAKDNRIAALTLDAGAAAFAGQHVILTGIPAAGNHNGGRLLAAPDGTLFVGTGDAAVKARAQDLGSLGGKILHITGTGSPAPGHPFPEAPLVYSFGHRNVQGLALDAAGRLWASEFGQNAYDELNLIRPGGNYGWPVVEGPSDDSRFVSPFRYWPTSDASPSGLAIVGDTALMAALRGERLWLIPLGGSAGATDPVAKLQGEYGRLRTVLSAPDGSVWLATSNTDGRGDVRPGDDRILRLSVG
jgi:glucose/arabinose dehydrogenase